jgi:hypothetical protein
MTTTIIIVMTRERMLFSVFEFILACANIKTNWMNESTIVKGWRDGLKECQVVKRACGNKPSYILKTLPDFGRDKFFC